MKKSRFSAEEIIGILNEAASGSVSAKELCQRHGITETTFYKWRQKYGGLQVNEARRLKALEEENRRLKRLVADLSLDNAMLKDVVGRKW
jgi:putative transposase